MFRITVRAWTRIIDPEQIKLDRLNIKGEIEFGWTDLAVHIEDIMQHSRYHNSPNNKTVIEFWDDRKPIVIKEPFESFSERLEKMEITLRETYDVEPEEEEDEDETIEFEEDFPEDEEGENDSEDEV